MFFVIVAILSILASTFTVTAAPTENIKGGSDQCGPIYQIPSDPNDTCSTAPAAINAGESAAYGITPLSNNYYDDIDRTVCDPVVSSICDIMANSSTTNGTWYFTTSSLHYDNGANPACQMGFYLPSYPEAAPRPSPAPCQNIFESIKNASDTGSVSGAQDWYGATMNLKVNPATAVGQFPLPGGSGTGK